MKKRNYFFIVASLFSLISLMQLSRIIFAWKANIGGWDVPMWLSGIFVLVAGFLAYSGFKLGSKDSALGQ